MQTNFFSYRLLIVVLIGIFISYLVQGLSPLRINTDSVAYLHMARSAWLGQGFMVAETTSYFPKGYSALLSLLHSIGLATPFMFVLLNTLFLFSGAFVYYFVFRNEYGINRVQGLFLIIFISLSYVSLKHTVITVSETAFFFVSSTVLFSLHVAKDKNRNRWIMLIVSLALAAEAFWIRTIGISLIPAILFSILVRAGQLNPVEFLKDYRTYLGLLLIGLVFSITLYAIAPYTTYDHIVLGLFRTSISEANLIGALILHVSWKLNEIAQITLNIPASILPEWFKVPFIGCGVFVLFFIIRGLCTQLRVLRYLDVYFISYSLIVLSWHYHDPRFWLPVIPFLLLFFMVGLGHYAHIRLINLAPRAWIFTYGVIGLLALTHSTYLTFSGKEFGNRYGNGAFRKIYKEAFYGIEATNKTAFEQQQLALLKWYEPLAKNR